MKKYLVLVLCLILISHPGYCFGWFKKDKDKKDQQEETYEGYHGSLPNIEGEFADKRESVKKPNAGNLDPNVNPDKLTPAPRDNDKYIDIVIKREKVAPYVNDVNDVIFILEKLKKTLESNSGTQFFNAQVGAFINNVNYIQDKYHHKAESESISYRRLVALSNSSREVALIAAQAQIYKKYLPYEDTGAAYSPQNLELQMQNLLIEVKSVLDELKSVK